MFIINCTKNLNEVNSKVRSHSNQYLSKLIMSDSRSKFQFNAKDRDPSQVTRISFGRPTCQSHLYVTLVHLSMRVFRAHDFHA